MVYISPLYIIIKRIFGVLSLSVECMTLNLRVEFKPHVRRGAYFEKKYVRIFVILAFGYFPLQKVKNEIK